LFLKTGDIVEITITDFSSSCLGVGHFGDLAVFVRGALPGDVIKVLIDKISKRYAQGHIIKLISPSGKRIKPQCPVASRCGGCSLQYMNYSAQLKWKSNHVTESLIRIGGFDRDQVNTLTKEILYPKVNLRYRNKVILPVGGTWENPQIGFYELNSHRIVDADECCVQHPFADRVREFFKDKIRKGLIIPYNETSGRGCLRAIMIRVGFETLQAMVVCVIAQNEVALLSSIRKELIALAQAEDLELTAFYANINERPENKILGEKFILIHGPGYIEENMEGIRFRISPEAFFQVHTAMANRMFLEVLNLANLKGHEDVLDLYCGTGSITLLLSRNCSKVTGIEISDQAIHDARINAKTNGIKNASFIVGKSETIIAQRVNEGLKADLVVLDPPRKGAERIVLDSIRKALPQKIVYVSCDPATLARDCSILCSESKYMITSITPVDLFPWTSHVEAIILMTRSGSGEKK
jgi:23S rRNA (uracil1939-C5)-methyltransferase